MVVARLGAAALLVIALALLALPTGATVLSLEGSTLELRVWDGSTLPVSVQDPDPIPVSVSSGAGGFVQPGSFFAHASGIGPYGTGGNGLIPDSAFTTISFVSSMAIDLDRNLSGSLAPGAGPGGGFGGAAPFTGFMTVGFLGGLIQFHFPMSIVGQGGGSQAAAAAVAVTVTGAAWTTGPAVVTGVTTSGGGIGNSVTVSGFDNRTAGHAGALQLVSPIRFLSNTNFNRPMFFIQTLQFVPEPGTLLLGATGAAGILWLGRRRGR